MRRIVCVSALTGRVSIPDSISAAAMAAPATIRNTVISCLLTVSSAVCNSSTGRDSTSAPSVLPLTSITADATATYAAPDSESTR